MSSANKTVRQSVSLPANVAAQVRNLARTRRLSSNRMLVELIENGIEAEKRKQQEFFELAERFRNTTDPREAKRLGDELGRMVFGGWHDHLDSPPLRHSSLVQPFELARMQDQFSQQRRNIHHKTLSAKPPAKLGQKIQRPHRNRSRHRHGMRRIRRNPHRPQRWHYPNALLRA